MAKAINDAVVWHSTRSLLTKPVEAAKARAEALNKDIYTEDSLKAIDEAVAAVVEGKKIDEQAEVDAMADAINDAVDKAEKKPADYSKVNEALEKAEELNRDIYTEDALKAIDEAVAAVVEGKKIDEQAEVDAMADAINDASMAEKKPADYSKVDEALKKVPSDLSGYTEVTVQAVNDAVAAVDRTKTASDQADVDEMAKAIEDAVAALKEQPVKFSYDGQDVSFINKAGSQFGMLTPQDGTTVSISGNNVVIHYVPKNKTTYGGFNWGSVDMLKYGDGTVNPGYDVAFNDDGTMDLTVSKDYCGYAHPIAVVKRSFSKNTWTSADQYYLAIPALKYFDADYSAVEAAKAKVPADLSIYTDASAQAVVKAVAAVIGGKKADEQAAVDAMAQAIEDAVAALKVKTGWQQEGGNWHYYSNGRMLKNAWAKANQGWWTQRGKESVGS